MERENIVTNPSTYQPLISPLVCVCPGLTPADPGERPADRGAGEDERGENSSQRTPSESQGREK